MHLGGIEEIVIERIDKLISDGVESAMKQIFTYLIDFCLGQQNKVLEINQSNCQSGQLIVNFMYRSSIDRDSPPVAVHKTSVSYSIVESRSSQKGSNVHFTEYTSLEKSQKKGIVTSIAFGSQNVSSQNVQEQVIQTTKQQDSVYEQYLQSLEKEIASRQRERIELQKGIDHLQNENGMLFNELSEEKKRCAGFRARVEQLQILGKQSEEKKRVLINEKEMVFKQYQYELQRCKNLEGNEMKLRSSFEAVQSELNTKVQQFNEMVSRLKEQNQNLKNTNERQVSDLKSMGQLNSSYKQQLSETVIEKDRIIEMLVKEKGLMEKEYQRGQKQHREEQKEQIEVKKLLYEREEQIRVLERKVTELEQQHQMQKDQLNYRISEIRFENSTLKKEIQSTKENMKRQLEVCVQQNQKLKGTISQLQKEKKVDMIHNEELHKEVDRLQREINALVERNAVMQKEKQSQKIHYQQEISQLGLRLQQLQAIHGEKCAMYDQMYRHFTQVEAEYQNYRISASAHIEALVNEINSVKMEFSRQVAEFNSETAKIVQEKEFWISEVNKVKKEHEEILKVQVQTFSRDGMTKQKETKVFYQNQIQLYSSKVQSLTQQILLLKQVHVQEMQLLKNEHQQKVITLQKQSLNSYKQLQENLKHQLAEKTYAAKLLNQKALNLERKLQSVTLELKSSTEAYTQLAAISSRNQTELKSQFSHIQSQLKFLLQQQKSKSHSQIITLQKQKQKLVEKFNHLSTSFNSLEAQSRQLKQIKSSLESALQRSEQASSSTIFELKNAIITLQQQKAELNSELIAKRNMAVRNLEEQSQQLSQKVDALSKQKRQLQSGLSSLIKQILSVIEFAQKYSGETINKKVKININTSSISGINQLFENCKIFCENLNTFIGERLYVISILMQENSQLKEQVERQGEQKRLMEEKLAAEFGQREGLRFQHQQVVKELQEVKKALQATSKQNSQSIAKLKEHIASNKRQLTIYEFEITEISSKFEQHEIKSFRDQARIGELEEELQHIKEEKQKLTQSHVSQVQSLKVKYEREMQLFKESQQASKASINQENNQTFTKLQKQFLSLQQKLQQQQKLIQTKTQQYEQLQKHSSLLLQRTHQSHQAQIQSLQRQIRYLKTKSNSPSKEIMKKKIEILEGEVEQRERELKVLEDNNKLLRKNFISALSEQESLREEVRLNRSQKSESRSKSREPSRKDSQELKNKYLLRKNSESKNSGTNEVVKMSDLTQSLGPRSCSNSNIVRSEKRFESPRGSEMRLNVLKVQKMSSNVERLNETERPVSSVQRSAPQIPLDLKRIRQRHHRGEDSREQQREVPSSISARKEDLRNEKLKQEEELYTMTSPIKILDPHVRQY